MMGTTGFTKNTKDGGRTFVNFVSSVVFSTQASRERDG